MAGAQNGSGAIPVTRTDIEMRPDSRRVIAKPFLPDEQVFPDDGLVGRILDLSEDEVTSTLAGVSARFRNRHPDWESLLESHFWYVQRKSSGLPTMSGNRRLLIGAYFTHEYSIEASALTNPSIVAAPDQSGLEPGAQRFIMSLRAVGEGHISSIEFRSGVVDAAGGITIETPTRWVRPGDRMPPVFDKDAFCAKLQEMDAFNGTASSLMDLLPDQFELRQLEAAINGVRRKGLPRRLSATTTRVIHWLATSNYHLAFPPDSKVSERVIFPGSAVESHGLEDARFVRFVGDDGSVTYYATYTAYDGFQVLPQLIETADFTSFRISTLSGACAQNKGAALFPRKIDGHFVALSRFDAENNYVMRSDHVRVWKDAEMIEAPEFPWEFARIGNCGSPLETEAGWLVVTHGVGPVRTYSLGAILLDLDDPARLIGHLEEPLVIPSEAEREGYVPNVVYSCGSMIHGGDLILPYGIADTSTRIARVPIDHLLSKLVG